MKQIVKKPSPVTGGKLQLRTKKTMVEYRGETISYEKKYYHCVDSGLEFADDELEEANLKLIYDTYRRRHNIPMAEELTKMRERYGIPSSAMSIILGIGENQYGLYEDGLVPSLSVGRLLELASNPLIMERMLLSARYKFSDKQYRKYYISIVASMHPAQYENDEMRVQDYINFSQFPSACVANTPAVQKSSIKYNSNKFAYAPAV